MLLNCSRERSGLKAGYVLWLLRERNKNALTGKTALIYVLYLRFQLFAQSTFFDLKNLGVFVTKQKKYKKNKNNDNNNI